MACLLSTPGPGPTVVTSGMKFVPLMENKFAVGTPILCVPSPLPVPGKPSSQPQPSPPEPFRILCGALSPSGKLLALADDHKQVTLWECEGWTCVRQWNVQRRANSVTFEEEEKKVVIADKSGDVFMFSTAEEKNKERGEEGHILLGHLSMLLEVVISPCGKYIATCDRDEKIRVSRFPNAYNITNFCLGHEDFVTGLAFASDAMLVSASGDGTIRVWDYRNGAQMGVTTCYRDLNISPLKVDPNQDSREEGKEGKAEYTHMKRTTPAVMRLRLTEVDQVALIAAQVEGYSGVAIYSLAKTATLTLHQKIPIESNIWDLQFHNNNGLWILVQDEPHLRMMTIKSQAFVSSKNIKLLDDLKDFWKDSCNGKSSLFNELNKRWFDNMKEYLERKEERIGNKKGKDVSNKGGGDREGGRGAETTATKRKKKQE